MCAEAAGTKVVYQLSDAIEQKGFSVPQNCILDNTKIKGLGWAAEYSLEEGICETLEAIRGWNEG